MSTFYRRLIQHRRLSMAIVGLLTVAAVVGLVRLRFDDDPRSSMQSNEPAYARLDRISHTFGSDDEGLVVVLETDAFFMPQRIAALREFMATVRSRPEVLETYSLLDARRPGPGRLQLPLFSESRDGPADMERARAAALASSLIRGQILSDDGRTSLVLIKLEPEAERDLARVGTLIAFIRGAAESLLEPAGIRAEMTGVPVVRLEVVRAMQRDAVVLNFGGLGLALLLSFALLRDWRAVLTATLPPALAALWITGFLGLVDVPINVLTLSTSTLVLVIGLSDSIHLSQDVWRRRRKASPSEAMVAALVETGSACGITALTTAVGFASLAWTDLPMIREYGLICTAGALTAFAATSLVVPLVAGLFPSYVADSAPAAGRAWIERTTRRLVTFSLKYRRAISFSCIAAMLPAGAMALGLRPDTRLTENIPTASTADDALARCDRVFGGVFHALIVVHWPADGGLGRPATEAALRDVQELFRRQDAVRNPLSLVNVVDEMPNLGRDWTERVEFLMHRPRESLRRFVNVERREALVLAHVSDLGTAALEALTFDLNRELDAVRARHPGFDFELSGSSIVGTAVINRLIGGLGTGLGLEAAIIFLLIASVFRSWRLGLVSLIPNLFPLACMATVMSGMGMSLHFGNVITFNVCLGLAVDDTVHVLNRIVHSRSPRSIDRLIVDCMSEVGPAVFATTLILCAGFAVMLLSSVPASRTFGGLACLMMAASFVAELLLLPALLAVFGEKALRRRVERYSREPVSTGALHSIDTGDV